MRHRRFLLPVLGSVLFVLLAAIAGAEDAKPIPLFPEIEPYDSGFLQVGDGHEIFYEQSGNPKGIPVFFLHGGPGAGCGPVHRRYYDPKKFRIVLHDQRGAGRSKPFAEVAGNTTPELVKDIEKLRVHLGIEKFLLVGGSWGSTLGLAYAEAHPERVTGLILRGVFLCTAGEIEHFYGGGTVTYFPEVVEKLWKDVPEMPGKSRPQRLLSLLLSPDAAVRNRTARAWAGYETKISRLVQSDEAVEKSLDSYDPLAFARIENHYLANGCFVPEGQLLRDAGKLRDIPAVLINGRYDVVCPPVNAWRLHQALPKSRLKIVDASGHSGGEPGIEQEILRAVQSFEGLQ